MLVILCVIFLSMEVYTFQVCVFCFYFEVYFGKLVLNSYANLSLWLLNIQCSMTIVMQGGRGCGLICAILFIRRLEYC